jgi:hypothetical protein
MKTVILITALVMGAGNVSANNSNGTEMSYPGGKKKKRGFNYRQHRHWVKGYPKCTMN